MINLPLWNKLMFDSIEKWNQSLKYDQTILRFKSMIYFWKYIHFLKTLICGSVSLDLMHQIAHNMHKYGLILNQIKIRTYVHTF